MSILDTLQSIYGVAKQIYDQVKLVKANNEQCKTLAERIRLVVTAVAKLEMVKDADHYLPSLKALESCLKNCLTFIEQFTQKKNWFKKVLNAGAYEGRFQELNDELQKAIQQLELGLNAQQIFNRDKDKQAQAKDHDSIKRNQNEIIDLNKQALQGVKNIELEQAEMKLIFGQQLASIRAHVAAFNIDKPKPKPLIDPHLTVPYYDLEFNATLAEGKFGKIYKGRWCEQEVAIKTFNGEMTEETMSQFIREVTLMGRLQHPNVTRLMGACIEAGRACLVMEYLEKGSLCTILQKNTFSAEQQQLVALNIAKGLHYLHKKDVLHRDLRSDNILLDTYGVAKLSDFSLSKTITTSIPSAREKSKSLQWQAPECLAGEHLYTEQCDIYSYGMILWEICTGKQPYTDCKEEDVIKRVIAGKRESIPKETPAIYSKLIEQCWSADPKKRPTLKYIIEQLEAYKPAATHTAKEDYTLGIKFEKEERFAEARTAYQRASAKGFYKADTNIGFLALKGLDSGKQNKNEAYQRFLTGAEQGHARAMKNLAHMLEHGDGVPRDTESASFWRMRAKTVASKDKKPRLKAEGQAEQKQQSPVLKN